MGRFDPVYSDAQREAMLEAMVDRNLSPREACGLAAEGKLAGLEPFTFNHSTAAAMKTQERRRRKAADWQKRAAGTIEQRLDAGAELMVDIAERTLRRLDTKLGQKRELDLNDLDRLRKAGQALREARSLHRGLPIVTGGGQAKTAAAKAGETVDDAPTTHPPSKVQELLDRHHAERNGQTDEETTARVLASARAS